MRKVKQDGSDLSQLLSAEKEGPRGSESIACLLRASSLGLLPSVIMRLATTAWQYRCYCPPFIEEETEAAKITALYS